MKLFVAEMKSLISVAAAHIPDSFHIASTTPFSPKSPG